MSWRLTKRAKEAKAKGQLLFRGRYRSHLEIAQWFVDSKEWAGSIVNFATPNYWILTHPTGATLKLKLS